MVISKDSLQYIVDTIPEEIDTFKLFEKIRLIGSLEQQRNDEGLNKNWEKVQESN